MTETHSEPETDAVCDEETQSPPPEAPATTAKPSDEPAQAAASEEEASAEEAPDVVDAEEAQTTGASEDAPGEEEEEEEEEPPEVVQLPDPELERLQETVGELQARLRAVSAAYAKVQEEIAATRDRLERQAQVKEALRRGEVVGELFDPLQNLKRSLEATRKGATTEDTTIGLEMVVQQFMDAFQKLGLEEVPGRGSRFNPMLHEALMLSPVTDPALDGVVIDVFSTGYRIGDKLIQPARVIVGQLAEEEPEIAEA